MLLALAMSTAVSAQVITGSITGRVTDPSGSTVPGAQITVANTQTGLEYRSQSNETGYYTVSALQPGDYQVTVRAEGFKGQSRGGLAIVSDQAARVDFTLEIGQVTETVEVTGRTPLLESESGALGTTMERQNIIDLPLNARNPFRLGLLLPGVTEGRNFGDSFNGSTRFSINGSRPMSLEVMIDGISNATPGAFSRTFIAITPPPDSLQEFKVQTNANSAEFGRTGGGVMNMVMKSGTNKFQGVLYEFLRNSSLDANNFFNNRNGRPLGSFKRNQFGGNAGGPIWRNKAWFFVSYEGLRQRDQNIRENVTVPTERERSGDFSQSSQLVGGVCRPVEIYDPATTAASGTGFTRSPFPNNIIPANRRDPAGVKLVSYYPLPNVPGVACTNANNFYSSQSTSYDTNQIDSKVDWAPNDKDRLFFGLSWFGNLRNQPNHYGTAGDTQGSYLVDEKIPAKTARLDYTRVQTPTLLFNIRGGVVRWERENPPYPEGFKLSDMGLPASLQSQMSQPLSFPAATAAGYSGLGNSIAFTYQAGTSYSLRGTGTWIKQAHNIKFGSDFRIFQSYEYSGFNTSGNFSFARNFTQGPNPNTAANNIGNGIASMLVGLGSGSMQILPPLLTSNDYLSLFVQDQWKVTSRLSVELGLRWDLETPRTERFDQLSYWDYDSPSPLAASVPSMPNLRGGLRFVGVDAEHQFRTDHNNFAPRVSLAWQLGSKTVLRAGYGLFYTSFVGMAVGGAAGSNGFLTTTSWVSSLDGLTPLNYFSNPYPQGLLAPAGSSQGLLTNVGQAITAQRDGAHDRGNRVGYMQQWNYGMQREVMGIVIEGAYVGSKGTKLYDPNGWDLNQLAPEHYALGTQLQQQVPNPFYGIIPAQAQLGARTITRSQLLRPYPQFLGIQDYWPAAVSSIYHGFQARAQKQFNQGIGFLFSFTAGKLIDDVGPHQNAYDRTQTRAVSTEDQRQRWVVSTVYELPYGKGKKFGATAHPLLRGILGDWQINGILTMASGYPLALTAPNSQAAITGQQVLRPNVNGNPKLSGDRTKDEKINRWFDTAVFSQPAPFTFGSTGASLPNVRSDGTKNLDFSVFKQFPLSETRHIEFRGEFFNALNRVQFGLPGQAFGGGNFGVIGSQANTPRQVQLVLKLIL